MSAPHAHAPEYPPPQHLLRDLRPRFEGADGERRMRVPVVRELLSVSGTLEPGVAAVLVDVLAGGSAIAAVAPDWAVTSDLSLQMCAPVASGAIQGHCERLRVGATQVVLEVTLRAPGSERPAVLAQLGFTRIARRAQTPRLRGDRAAEVSFEEEEDELRAPFYERIGVREIDAGAGELALDLDAYHRNSVGALQGGVALALAVRAAELWARARLGGEAAVSDLSAHYLAMGRVGPVHTYVQVLRSDAGSAALRVELRDEGQGGRLLAVVALRVAPPLRAVAETARPATGSAGGPS